MNKKESAPTPTEALTNSENLPNKRIMYRCPYCRVTNGSKMWKLSVSGNRSAYVHAVCIYELGGMAATIEWLETHLPWNLNISVARSTK